MYSHPIKRSIIIFALLLLKFNPTIGQDILGVVDYMKVSNHAEYLEVEKQWQKIHEIRFKKGTIIGWGVYQVMFKELDNPYNFVSISWYDNFSKLDKGIPDEVFEEAFPEKSEEDLKAFFARTEQSRERLTSRVFQQQLSCSDLLDHSSKYYAITEINVKRGKSKAYLALKEEIYKPLFEEAIHNNNRASWSLWAKWPSNMEGYQYLSADGYTSLEQVDEVDYLQYFQKIHPQKNIDQINDKEEELGNIIGSEMWKTIYRVYK
jgi:hypothetical protein